MSSSETVVLICAVVLVFAFIMIYSNNEKRKLMRQEKELRNMCDEKDRLRRHYEIMRKRAYMQHLHNLRREQYARRMAEQRAQEAQEAAQSAENANNVNNNMNENAETFWDNMEFMENNNTEKNSNDPSVGMPNGATSERKEKNNALMDAREMDPKDLLPDMSEMDDEWKSMFSHAENTLAQENFIEPSYEYAIGSINMPKRYLTQDLRGQPPITTYEGLTPFLNSNVAGMNVSEIGIRRAGDL